MKMELFPPIWDSENILHFSIFIHFYLNLYWRIGKELFDFATRGQARVVVLLLVIWKPTISLFLNSLLVLLWYLILLETFYKRT